MINFLNKKNDKSSKKEFVENIPEERISPEDLKLIKLKKSNKETLEKIKFFDDILTIVINKLNFSDEKLDDILKNIKKFSHRKFIADEIENDYFYKKKIKEVQISREKNETNKNIVDLNVVNKNKICKIFEFKENSKENIKTSKIIF